MIDSMDIHILNILQSNGKITNAELARQIGMAPSGVLERVKKLEQKGIIQGYEVRLSPKALGISLSTFILIKTEDAVGSAEIGKQLAKIAAVQEVHWTAGEYNYLVKARVSSTDTLAQLMKKFGEIPGVRDSRTTLVLDTIKETQALSLDYIEYKQPKKTPK